MSVYLRVKFQVSGITLTSFRQGGNFTPPPFPPRTTSKQKPLKIPSRLGLIQVDVDLFVSRFCHQIPRYMSWQPHPHAYMIDPFQINWAHLKVYALQSFAIIGRVLAKAMTDKCTLMIITPV